MSLGRHPYLAAALLTGALVVWFFAPVILRNETFSTVENLQEFSYPWFNPASPPVHLYPQLDQANFVHPRQEFLDRSLKVEHQIPLWDPLTFGGHPFFAGTGSRLAYPPLLLLSLSFSPSWTHDLYIALHLFVAEVAVFALMRELEVGMGGALLSSMAWAFGSYTLGWVMLEMFAAPAALLPLALLCARRWYDRDSWPALLTGALVLGLLFLGTSVENALFCFLCVGGYLACLVLTRLIRRWSALSTRSRVALLAAPAVFMAGAASVAAIGILPFLDLNASSERAGTAMYSRALSVVPWKTFRYLFTPPPVLTDPFKATSILIRGQVFVGLAAALLAVIGLFVRRPGSGLGRGLVVGLFLFTVGTPVTWLALRVVPQLGALNGFGRALFLFDLGVAVLAGLGLDAVLGALRRRTRRDAGRKPARALLMLPALLTALCLGATATQLITYGRRVNPPFQPRTDAELFPSTPAIDAARAVIGDRPGRSPILPVRHPGGYAVLFGTVGMALDLPTVSGYEPVVPASVSKLWRVVAGEPLSSVLSRPLPGTLLLAFDTKVRTDLLGRTGVAAVMGPPDLNAEPGWDLDSLSARGLRQTYGGPDGTVLEVLDHRPRAAVVSDAIWAASPTEALARFTDASFDARRQVVLEGRPVGLDGSASTAVTQPGAQGIDWRIDSPNHLRLNVTSERSGWLVLLDGWDPGWTARVNGRTTDVRRANSNFRAVKVPAGSSTVDFTYRPKSILVGAAISMVSIVLILAVVIFGVIRRRRSTSRRDRQPV